jgi:hypothetical protein
MSRCRLPAIPSLPAPPSPARTRRGTGEGTERAERSGGSEGEPSRRPSPPLPRPGRACGPVAWTRAAARPSGLLRTRPPRLLQLRPRLIANQRGRPYRTRHSSLCVAGPYQEHPEGEGPRCHCARSSGRRDRACERNSASSAQRATCSRASIRACCRTRAPSATRAAVSRGEHGCAMSCQQRARLSRHWGSGGEGTQRGGSVRQVHLIHVASSNARETKSDTSDPRANVMNAQVSTREYLSAPCGTREYLRAQPSTFTRRNGSSRLSGSPSCSTKTCRRRAPTRPSRSASNGSSLCRCACVSVRMRACVCERACAAYLSTTRTAAGFQTAEYR